MTRAQRIQQTVKWIVYSLLLVNFAYYIVEDWNRASHVLTDGAPFLKWTSEFATSIDLLAWFTLLLMFELETYVLDDDTWDGWVALAVRGVRLICIIMIAHTIYAFSTALLDIQPTRQVEGIDNLCELTERDLSFVYNLEYTEVTAETCSDLPIANEYYWVSNDPIVSTLAGLKLERNLIVADLSEVIIWVVILLFIELVVRLQGRGVASGLLITTLNRSKIVLYAALIGIGIYWASLSHWLYLWDELLWIGGFAAIEMNVSEWRDELLGETA